MRPARTAAASRTSRTAPSTGPRVHRRPPRQWRHPRQVGQHAVGDRVPRLPHRPRQKCGLTGGGCYQQFQGGRIYWSPASGAHAMVTGAIWDLWKAQGYEKGALGYPTGDRCAACADNGCLAALPEGHRLPSASPPGPDRQRRHPRQVGRTEVPRPASSATRRPREQCGLTGGGCYQQFQGGRIYWSPASGAHVMVTGAIWDLWKAQGYEKGALGYPHRRPDVRPARTTAAPSTSRRAPSTPRRRTRPAIVSGAILAKYAAPKCPGRPPRLPHGRGDGAASPAAAASRSSRAAGSTGPRPAARTPW